MGNLSSYLYLGETEVPISGTEKRSYTTAREICFHKLSGQKYYTIIPELDWITCKKIPQGTYFVVSKIIKDEKGQKFILGSFDQEPELLDVTRAFVNTDPLIPRLGWAKDFFNTS